MNISGILVQAYPENIRSVCRALSDMEGVEVHASNDDGKIVVTIEQEGNAGMSDMLLSLQNLPGVLAASMVYHQFDDAI
jgi:nitrate reductase NapD